MSLPRLEIELTTSRFYSHILCLSAATGLAYISMYIYGYGDDDDHSNFDDVHSACDDDETKSKI